MSITQRIRIALEDRNLLEVSKRAGVAYSAIRKVTKGHGDSISVRTSNRLAKYLGITDNETDQSDTN